MWTGSYSCVFKMLKISTKCDKVTFLVKELIGCKYKGRKAQEMIGKWR